MVTLAISPFIKVVAGILFDRMADTHADDVLCKLSLPAVVLLTDKLF
jgi:hypothetical protein